MLVPNSPAIADEASEAYETSLAMQLSKPVAAFSYVSLLEIPTPRWTTYDAKRFGVKLPTDVPTTIQERAYTSSIWYTP
jgi:Protein of unknown function (DUF3604)